MCKKARVWLSFSPFLPVCLLCLPFDSHSFLCKLRSSTFSFFYLKHTYAFIHLCAVNLYPRKYKKSREYFRVVNNLSHSHVSSFGFFLSPLRRVFMHAVYADGAFLPVETQTADSNGCILCQTIVLCSFVNHMGHEENRVNRCSKELLSIFFLHFNDNLFLCLQMNFVFSLFSSLCHFAHLGAHNAEKEKRLKILTSHRLLFYHRRFHFWVDAFSCSSSYVWVST